MGKPRRQNSPTMTAWEGGGIGFVRFDLPNSVEVEIEKVFHDNIVMLAFEGCKWTTRNGGESRIEVPGGVILRDAGQVFSIKSEQIDLAGGKCYEIHMPSAALADVYSLADNPLPEFEFSQSLIENPTLARELIRTHKLYDKANCELEASEALANLLSNIASQTSLSALKRQAAICSKRMERIVEYLRGNFDKSVSLPELAALVEMNPFVLQRQFQRQYGISPHEYLAIHRINMAKQHIQVGTALADVAHLCGFADQSHLTRQFKRRTGLTPGNYVPQKRTKPASAVV
jgi:AraC-like DNA-binding protein